MPYKWTPPAVACSSNDRGAKIFYAYKDDFALIYHFCTHELESDNGGKQFDIRNQKIYQDLDRRFNKKLTEWELIAMSLAYLVRNVDKITW